MSKLLDFFFGRRGGGHPYQYTVHSPPEHVSAMLSSQELHALRVGRARLTCDRHDADGLVPDPLVLQHPVEGLLVQEEAAPGALALPVRGVRVRVRVGQLHHLHGLAEVAAVLVVDHAAGREGKGREGAEKPGGGKMRRKRKNAQKMRETAAKKKWCGFFFFSAEWCYQDARIWPESRIFPPKRKFYSSKCNQQKVPFLCRKMLKSIH